MSGLTLQKILENIFSAMSAETEIISSIDITFKVLKQLYELEQDGHLPSEMKVFLNGKNAVSHMNNIIDDIVQMRTDISSAIDTEFSSIGNDLFNNNSEATLPEDYKEVIYDSKEEMNQLLFRRTGQIHGHLNNLEIFLKEYIESNDAEDSHTMAKENMENIKNLLKALEKLIPGIEYISETMISVKTDSSKITKTCDTVSHLTSDIHKMSSSLINSSNASMTNLETIFNLLTDIKETVDRGNQMGNVSVQSRQQSMRSQSSTRQTSIKSPESSLNMDMITGSGKNTKKKVANNIINGSSSSQKPIQLSTRRLSEDSRTQELY